MAQFFTCCSPNQNSHNGENELAGGTPIKGSNRYIPAPATTYAFTPTFAPVVAPLAASSSANSFMIRYLEDDLQWIVKTILNARSLSSPTLVPVPASVVAATPHYEDPRERPLIA